MAKDPHISNAAAIAACNAVVDLVDADASAGKIRIYDGTKPADGPDEAIVAQTLLAELTMSDPAFGAAADNNPGGRATANSIADDSSADATGTASWFRMLDGANVAILDGTVGTSDADMILNTVSITSGSTVSITSATVTMPESN